MGHSREWIAPYDLRHLLGTREDLSHRVIMMASQPTLAVSNAATISFYQPILAASNGAVAWQNPGLTRILADLILSQEASPPRVDK